MHDLHIDLETYSSISIRDAGLWKYLLSPDFEILLFAYSVDDNPVQIIDLAQGEVVPGSGLSQHYMTQHISNTRTMPHSSTAVYQDISVRWNQATGAVLCSTHSIVDTQPAWSQSVKRWDFQRISKSSIRVKHLSDIFVPLASLQKAMEAGQETYRSMIWRNGICSRNIACRTLLRKKI